MTAHFQFFMILGAAILLLIIFALLKKGQMAGTGRGSCHLCGIPLCCLRPA